MSSTEETAKDIEAIVTNSFRAGYFNARAGFSLQEGLDDYCEFLEKSSDQGGQG